MKNAKKQNYGKFLTGSLFKHIIAMLSAAAIGILAQAIVQLVDGVFLSNLHDISITASLGYTGTVLFFLAPIASGLSTASATVSGHLIGLNRPNKFRRYATNMIIFSVLCLLAGAIIIYVVKPYFYKALGASGAIYEYSMTYGSIMLFFVTIASFTMILNSIRSAVGDAKGVLYVNITMSAVNGILDPIFIFGFHLGINGAGYASVISGIVALIITFTQIHRKLNILVPTRWKWFILDIRRSLKYFFSSIFGMLSPTLSSVVTIHIATGHGEEVVSSLALLGRVVPLIFGSIAMGIGSAISPIISQNYTAKNYSRIVEAIKWACLLTVIYVAVAWFIMICGGTDFILYLLSLENQEVSKHIFKQFFTYLTPFWIPLTLSFCLNGVFVALGYPMSATLLSFFRLVVYTAPMAYVIDIYASKFYAFAGVMAPLYARMSGGLVTIIVALPLFIYILQKKIKPKMVKIPQEQNLSKSP